MNMSQELFNTLMDALQLAYDESSGNRKYHDAEQSLADTFPELRKVWWTDNSWQFNGFPE
mgnify:CR=1 FL=1